MTLTLNLRTLHPCPLCCHGKLSTVVLSQRFMGATNIPKDMRMRLREYFHQSKHLADTVTRRNLLDKMSPQLAGEVALQVNEKWLRRVWFLNGAGQEFVVQIALQLQAMVFTIGEVINNGYLYIINRGIALFGGRVLTAGSVWGEDMLLDSHWLMSKFCARAMTYLEVYTIGREQLMEAASQFPYTRKHLRRCAVRLAVRREFVRLSKLARAEREADMLNVASELRTPGASKKFMIDQMLDKASGVKGEKTHNLTRSLSTGEHEMLPPPPPLSPTKGPSSVPPQRVPSPEFARRMMTMDEAVGAGRGEAGAVDGDAVSALMQTMARLETQQATNHSLAASEFARLETQQVRLAIPLRLHHGGPSYSPPPPLSLARRSNWQSRLLINLLALTRAWRSYSGVRCGGTTACWFGARGRMI